MKVRNRDYVVVQINIDNSENNGNIDYENTTNKNPEDHASEPNSGQPPSSSSKKSTSNKGIRASLLVLAMLALVLLLILAGLLVDAERFERILSTLFSSTSAFIGLLLHFSNL